MKIIISFLFLVLFLTLKTPVYAGDMDVLVNEVMYDFPGSDIDHEWVELYNSGNEPVTITGGTATGSWRIYDGLSNRVFSTTPSQGSMTIGSKDYVVIVQDASIFLSDNPDFTGNLIQSSAMSLGNTSEEVGLRIGSSGVIWGQLSYNNSQGATGDGNSLQRQSDGTLLAGLPTPGKANTSIAPTPTVTSSPTKTTTPTKTQTPTPTKSPTATPKPTLKATAVKATPTKSEVKSEEGVVLSQNITTKATESAEAEPTPTPTPEVLTAGFFENNLPKVLIIVGGIFLVSAGLLFVKLKGKTTTNGEGNDK